MFSDSHLILGSATPMKHQLEDVQRLKYHPRINVYNGLGTGKTMTVCWWLQELWLAGTIDEVVITLPGMCARDWMDTFRGVAWPDDLVEVIDCRPPNAGEILEMITSKSRVPQGKLRVMITTYGGMRKLASEKRGRSRISSNDDMEIFQHMRGRRIAAVFDESQRAAHASAQGTACRAFARASRAVASMTATPIGNPLQLRLWGMAGLVRPDILTRQEPDLIRNRPVGKRGSMAAFKMRYCHLRDPNEGKPSRSGKLQPFVAARAYPIAIHTDLIQDEILGPMASYTARRKKDDCLDLPPKIYMRRFVRLSAQARRALLGLVEDDRAVLDSGSVVVPSNILEERLRCLEITGGWLVGEPVHDGKLVALRDVLEEIREAEGERAPICIWASRSREVLASALVSAGAKPAEALQRATAIYPAGQNTAVRHEYSGAIDFCARHRVGVLHGPTAERDRDRIQDSWKSGNIDTVVAHPGVAGAGLNWQHVKSSIYYSQPLGTIARQQSEDRVHRHGLKHKAIYWDLVVEDGPDEAVAAAHTMQRDAAQALLEWMLGVINSG